MIGHVLAAVSALEPRRLGIAIGPEDDDLAKELEPSAADVARVPANVHFDLCAAVLTVLAGWSADDLDIDLDPDDDDVLVISAALPLLQGETLRALHRAHRSGDAAATCLTGPGDDVRPIDSAVWFVRRSLLAPALRRSEAPEIAAIGEVLHETGHQVAEFVAADEASQREVFDRADLARAEAEMRARINARWLRRGVTMLDPERTYVDVGVELARDVTLHPGVELRGATAVGTGSEIGPGCHLVDSRVGANCRLEQTSAELATVGDNARVGPFAVLEPGSEIPAATVTGPFYTAGPDAR